MFSAKFFSYRKIQEKMIKFQFLNASNPHPSAKHPQVGISAIIFRILFSIILQNFNSESFFPIVIFISLFLFPFFFSFFYIEGKFFFLLDIWNTPWSHFVEIYENACIYKMHFDPCPPPPFTPLISYRRGLLECCSGYSTLQFCQISKLHDFFSNCHIFCLRCLNLAWTSSTWLALILLKLKKNKYNMYFLYMYII